MTDAELALFVKESNHIEGIFRDPTPAEVAAHFEFLQLMVPLITALENFVAVVAPGKPLRTKPDMNVRVGAHVAPRGGPKIAAALSALLVEAETGDPYVVHQKYEQLHPFMDGNGRSGRLLWLWMMQERGEIARVRALGFLHCWYYQSLAGYRK